MGLNYGSVVKEEVRNGEGKSTKVSRVAAQSPALLQDLAGKLLSTEYVWITLKLEI